ncbi:PAS domain S-box protein [bacterium]|nr:PAS domain S-box protein [bacterium]
MNPRDPRSGSAVPTGHREPEVELYRALVMQSSDCLIVHDLEGWIRDVNPRACKTYGYAHDELVGMHLRVLDPDYDERSEGGAIFDRIEADEPMVFEARQRTRDGHVFPVEVRISLVRFEGETLVQGLCRDITRRRESEQRLRESEERFRLLLNDVEMVAIQGYAPDGTTQYWNEGSRRLYGYTPEEALGSNLLDLIIPEPMHDEVRGALAAMARTGRPIPSSELLLRHKDGSSVEVYSCHSVLQRPGHRPELFCIDIDLGEINRGKRERERLQTELMQAQKMESVGRLAGGVAHDFNNMLNVILGHTEMLLDDLGEESHTRAGLEEIRQAAGRSAELTRQLLAFARRQTVAPRLLDLNASVEAMLTMLRRLIGEDIELCWRPSPSLDPVEMDPVQLDQLLANLVVNGRDAIGRGKGRVVIETGTAELDEASCARRAGAAPGSYVVLSVSDDGHGIDERDLPHIFEPFYTTKKAGEGTGLGLATVYGVVKQNDGFVGVESELGAGTTVRVHLPARAGATATPPREAPAEVPVSVRGETVLLVEDEPAILELGERLLTSLGYEVLAAASPGEAIRVAREHDGPIPLLITDVVIPEMNGQELSENLREGRPDLVTVFMSGYTTDAIAHRGVLDDGVRFLQKPFSRRDLAVRVQEALEGR